nr:hypothetical protein [Tanacetum cinerariifolium]
MNKLDELTKAEIKQMKVDDQAIQTILLGLLGDIYVAVDSCETAQEIWLRADVYKSYDDAYNGVGVPMMQPSPVVSTQGTNRTLSASSPPKPKTTSKKMKDKVIGESSEPKKMLMFKIKTKVLVVPIPTAAEIKKDQMIEAEQLSHAIAESAKEGEAKSNADLVEEAVDVADCNTEVLQSS